MKRKELISIIIPYFKKKKYFKETIKSILNQTYQNYEIIIIYDDECLKELNFVKSTLKKIKRKKIILNKKNYGAGISRNKGILYSKGNYLAFCDADDLWLKNKLFLQLNFMLKNNLMICHTNYFIINEKSEVIGKYSVNDKLNYNDLLKSCDIGLSTVMLKKQLMNQYKFNKLRTKEDYFLWLQIVKKIKYIYGLNQHLSSWRKTKNSLSSSTFQKILDSYKLYRVHLKNNFIISILLSLRLAIYALNKKILILKNINN